MAAMLDGYGLGRPEFISFLRAAFAERRPRKGGEGEGTIMMDGAMSIGDEEEGSIIWLSANDWFALQFERMIRDKAYRAVEKENVIEFSS